MFVKKSYSEESPIVHSTWFPDIETYTYLLRVNRCQKDSKHEPGSNNGFAEQHLNHSQSLSIPFQSWDRPALECINWSASLRQIREDYPHLEGARRSGLWRQNDCRGVSWEGFWRDYTNEPVDWELEQFVSSTGEVKLAKGWRNKTAKK
jgi:hypothetical protein